MNVRSIADLTATERAALFDRDAGVGEVRETVEEIIDRVRSEGDAALRSYASKFDGVEIGAIEVTDQLERTTETIDGDILAAIEHAAENIEAFHERQLPADWRDSFGGRELGRRYRPIERVGVYAPGGTAAYPSSVLMGVIPAKVAGVEHVAVATPPADELPPATLAAASVASADAVYQIGGAQAIAALAYGTETVSPTQKIVGPGNRFVTAAKAAVRGDCEIEFLAGPSEILVICDGSADPELVAADLVAQAEHDENASAVCVTDDEEMAAAVAAEIERQIQLRERQAVIEAALGSDASGVLLARSLSEAVLFAEEYAAEHLSIQTADDEALLDRIDSAGSVFLGPYSPVAAGDYATGPNHVLPTGGLAKVAGGLSVEEFLRSTTIQKLDRDALSDLHETVATLARTEGLEAHAESVDTRFRNRE